MVGFSVLLYLYINRNISDIVCNKKYLYMTHLVEGYNVWLLYYGCHLITLFEMLYSICKPIHTA